MNGFNEQIAAAKQSIRERKRTAPWLLPEWVKMHHAEQEFRKALRNYERAKDAWEKLGT